MVFSNGYSDPGYDFMLQQGWKITFEGLITDATVSFRSAITQFSDTYTSNWAREEVYGRMDPIPVFKNTQRVITFGWQIMAADLNEARINNAGISRLIQMLYPSYDEYQKETAGRPAIRLLSGSPIIKIKFANLITDPTDMGGLAGTIQGFTHTPNIDAGFFTVANPEEPGYEDLDMGSLYPKAVDATCTFYPLHSHTLGVRGGPSVAASALAGYKGKAPPTDAQKAKDKAAMKTLSEDKDFLESLGKKGMPFEPGFPYGNPVLNTEDAAPMTSEEFMYNYETAQKAKEAQQKVMLAESNS